jgi:PAS domain S-box-containing protein
MEDRARILSKLCNIYCWMVMVVSACAFLGWLVDNLALKSSLIGSNPMNPMAAVLFILSAAAVLLNKSRLSTRSIGVLVIHFIIILVSLCRLTQFTIGLPFRIDHLFFGTLWGTENDGVNYMAPSAAVLFFISSTAHIMVVIKRLLWLSEVLIYMSFLCSLFFLFGFLFDAPEFKTNVHLFPASQTCVLFLFLLWAIAFARPTEGLVGLMITELEGSRIGRYLFPFTFTVPILIAVARLAMHRGHYFSFEFGVGSVTLIYFLIFMVALFAIVLSLNSRDLQRIEATKKINELNKEMTHVNGVQKAMNNDLTASNEKIQLRSTELQKANKELSLVNVQLAEALTKIKDQDELIIKQKEDALKRSQQYLEIIFSNTEEEILLLDKEGRAVLFNSAFEKFMKLAVGKKPVIGEYVWNITLPERTEISKQLFAEAVSGKPVKQEALVNLPTGKIFHFLRYEPVSINGAVEFVTIISTDITQQRDVSEKLAVQYEELQKVNYELDKFVYSVSHDLRAPLSSVLGLINVAEMENNGKELPYLKLIKDRIKHLDGFIRSILDYSRNARTEVTPTLISVATAVQEVKDSVRTMNGFNSIDIQVNIQEKAPFYSDAIRFVIIVNNLITNAIKFQDYNKPDSYLQLDFNITEHAMQMRASDNGIGIASDHLQKVFDMFYRGTASASGSGIGLYLVKQTVEKMNGTIALTSEFGKYTTFEVMLPNNKG